MFLHIFLNGRSDNLCLLNRASKMLKGPRYFFIIIVNSSVFDSIAKRIFGFINVHFKIRDFRNIRDTLKSRIFSAERRLKVLRALLGIFEFITIYSPHNPKPSFLHSHTPSRLFFVLSKGGNNQKKLVR